MSQLKDIEQKIKEGLSDRQIAKCIGKRRALIAQIRKGTFSQNEESDFPDWMQEINWEEVIKEIGFKHPIKFIWEEFAKDLTSYVNFTKYLYKKFPEIKIKPYTHREFNPGERVEVDWAGDVISYYDSLEKRDKKAYIFISCLCYSQLIFARAFESTKQIDFLTAHERMFRFYGGVPKVIVPDNAKTAVIKSHRYDPDLNSEYNEFTKHYGITVAPARAYAPKDKPLVEVSVKLVQRLFRWKSRGKKYYSLLEINKALEEVYKEINTKVHTRYKVSRNELFEVEEKSLLKRLPELHYELCESQFCKVHPDGTVALRNQYYSVPYKLTGKSVVVKIKVNTLEIFYNLESVAVHKKLNGRKGQKSIQEVHIPESAQFYRNTNVQNLLRQSGYVSSEFRKLIEELLTENPTGHLRRAQGFIVEARRYKGKASVEVFNKILKKSIEEMKLYGRVRVEKFKIYMKDNYDKEFEKKEIEIIKRDSHNPMLRSNETYH